MMMMMMTMTTMCVLSVRPGHPVPSTKGRFGNRAVRNGS